MNNETKTVFTRRPSVEEIRSLDLTQGYCSFIVPKDVVSHDYMISLQNEFADKLVGFNNYDHSIFIDDALSTSVVLQNLGMFYECFEAFGQLAHELMSRIGEQYKIDVSNAADIYRLKTKVLHRQHGTLNEEWEFRFHGQDCWFKHLTTKQTLDVFVQVPLQFGALNGYSTMQFISTTTGMEKASALLDGKPANMLKIIQVMHNEGFLIPIDSEFWKDKLTLNPNKSPKITNDEPV